MDGPEEDEDMILRLNEAEIVYVSHTCRRCRQVIMVKMIRARDRLFYIGEEAMIAVSGGYSRAGGAPAQCPLCGASGDYSYNREPVLPLTRNTVGEDENEED